MLKTRVIPCLLLKNGGLVKTIKFKNPRYIGDPINTVRIFNDKEVDELILLDITVSVERRKPQFKLISEIASECFMPLCYGGGITCVDDIRTILSLGVEKVSLNSCAIEDPKVISSAAGVFGCQSIIVSIDISRNFFGKYEVFGRSGTKNAKTDPVEFAKHVEELGAGEILINSIDRDGTMTGYDVPVIRRICDAVKIPVIACGGAGGIKDFTRAVKEGGASAVAAGSLFVYHGPNKAVLINFPSQKDLGEALD